tara:strand:+ start:293 stop:529 length:237 start_codon:yes stop_codon:yes gene_type:complete
MQKTDTKILSVAGDVELVAQMETALKDGLRYEVSISNNRWDQSYKQHWETTIRKIDHWNDLKFRYDSKKDCFKFRRIN